MNNRGDKAGLKKQDLWNKRRGSFTITLGNVATIGGKFAKSPDFRIGRHK